MVGLSKSIKSNAYYKILHFFFKTKLDKNRQNFSKKYLFYEKTLAEIQREHKVWRHQRVLTIPIYLTK